MTRLFKDLWIITAILVVLTLVGGLAIPTLISTNKLPALVIVVAVGAMVASVLSLLVYLVRRL